MRKTVLALSLSLLGANAATAAETDMEKRDMSTLTCEQFLEFGAPDAIITLFWMDGYLAKDDDTPTWDRERFVDHRDKLLTICTAEDGGDKLVLEEVDSLD